jgi:hypothetical protein
MSPPMFVTVAVACDAVAVLIKLNVPRHGHYHALACTGSFP